MESRFEAVVRQFEGHLRSRGYETVRQPGRPGRYVSYIYQIRPGRADGETQWPDYGKDDYQMKCEFDGRDFDGFENGDHIAEDAIFNFLDQNPDLKAGKAVRFSNPYQYILGETIRNYPGTVESQDLGWDTSGMYWTVWLTVRFKFKRADGTSSEDTMHIPAEWCRADRHPEDGGASR